MARSLMTKSLSEGLTGVIHESLWDQARGCPKSQHKVAENTEGEKRECSPPSFLSFQFPGDDEGHLTRECAGPSGPERAGQVSFPVQEDLRADRH